MSQVARVVFAVCVLTATATVCLVTHELMWSTSPSSRAGAVLVPKRHPGLMELLANVTQAVAAMEVQAHNLDAELEHMRQQTRQLLWQRRKDALWSAIHKCIFLYGCNEQNLQPLGKPIKGSNFSVPSYSVVSPNVTTRQTWDSVYNGSKYRINRRFYHGDSSSHSRAN